jgi:hypothetical protein
LIKLRETLLDSGEKSKVTVPDGLAVYPNNKLWAFLMLIAILTGFIGFMIPVIEAEKKSKKKTATNNR